MVFKTKKVTAINSITEGTDLTGKFAGKDKTPFEKTTGFGQVDLSSVKLKVPADLGQNKKEPTEVGYTYRPPTLDWYLGQLASTAEHQLVLQHCAAGWYVQIQIVKEPVVKSESKVLDLVWQPITGIHDNPMGAVLEATEVPFGRNLSAPSSDIPPAANLAGNASQKPVEAIAQDTEEEKNLAEQAPSDHIPDHVLKAIAEPTTVKPKRSISPITFIAYKVDQATKERVPLVLDVSNRQGDILFCTVVNSKGPVGVVFDLSKGHSIKSKVVYVIPRQTLPTLEALTKEIDNDAVLIDREKPSDYIKLEKADGETLTEKQYRLNALLGRRIKANRLFHTNGKFPEVEGLYVGKTHVVTKKGKDPYLVHGLQPAGTTNTVAIQEDTIKEAE